MRCPAVTIQPVTVPDRLQHALHRLGAALDHLEAAAARRAQADAARGNLEDELAVMQDDRARLATELDAVLARTRTLLNANTEVALRLKRANATVRAVLAQVDPGADPADPA